MTSISINGGSSLSTRPWGSSVDLTTLPTLPQLQTWVHRPQALAKCTIADVYRMRAVVYEGAGRYAGRDVFLLDRFPCRMVELVGWVAGVDEKEKTQVVYLDDGDGQHVMPITIRLSLVERNVNTVNPSSSIPSPQGDERTPTQYTPKSHHFLSAKERKAQRKAAAQLEASQISKGKQRGLPPIKVYERNDVRVGDIVRVRGKVDEWMRGKEWVRQIAVEPGAGGTVVVVDPDEQYRHLRQVAELHRTVYSVPFSLPPAPLASSSTAPVVLPTPKRDTSIIDLTFSDSLSTSFEPSSDMSIDCDQIKLCDPSRLRPSQLTDRTFRHYLLDHMTQQTIERMNEISFEGQKAVRETLQVIFPEYREVWSSRQSSRPGTGPSTPTPRNNGRAPFGPCSTQNIDISDIDSDLTPRRSARKSSGKILPRCSAISPLHGFTIVLLLEVPQLYDLAVLVVDEQSRKEEKRRRRRIRDDQATPKDLEADRTRQGKGWRLTDTERRARMERLVKWVIRGLSEEGVIVQAGSGDAYIPLPESLLFPLILPHIEAESTRRAKTFIRKTDERYGHGILLGEVMGRLKRFGEAGRWERVGEWRVEDALAWGEQRGIVRRVGKGWVVVEA